MVLVMYRIAFPIRRRMFALFFQPHGDASIIIGTLWAPRPIL